MSSNDLVLNKRLDYNIYGSNGELLVGIGTPINKHMIMHLRNRKWYKGDPNQYIYENIALLDNEFDPIIDDKRVSPSKILERARKIVELVKNNPIIYSNLKKLEEYDTYTYLHSNQVAYLAVAMGIKYGLNTHDLVNLSIASLIHDIGKCAIDESIINKPGKLTKEEYEIVKNHPQYAVDMLEGQNSIEDEVLKFILHHHENYDGSGYPYGLKKDEIPFSSSILHVCDVFDALTSVRSYKPKINEYESIKIIKDDSGTAFDPDVVEIFTSSMQLYSIGSVIELEDGSTAVITEVEKDSNGNVTKMVLSKQGKVKVYQRNIS